MNIQQIPSKNKKPKNLPSIRKICPSIRKTNPARRKTSPFTKKFQREGEGLR